MWRRTSSLTAFLLVALAALLSLFTGVRIAHARSDGVSVEQTATATDTPGAPNMPEKKNDDPARPAGWTDASHGNKVDPNYAVVFPSDAVQTITITIGLEDWIGMQTNLASILGPPMEPKIDLEKVKAQADIEAAALAEAAVVASSVPVGQRPPQQPAPDVKQPMWVPATIAFNGQTWNNVGVRYKGVSSLGGPWRLGSPSLPLKLDFDQFEDEYPEIKNQRFFGFKQLSLANNFGDPSFLRDTISYALLEEAGLPSLQTALYEVVLEHGGAPLHLGLYTMVEVLDDTGVPAWFGSDDGNIYEGNGPGASFSVDKADRLEAYLEKKNNEDEADYSDIWRLYAILHDTRRTTDPAAWRADLEEVFDVDVFLEWVGMVSLISHIDTYGYAAHNFYIYHDPATDKLTWISWDHNFTFVPDAIGVTAFDRAKVKEVFPLVRYLLDDPVYYDRYLALLAENVDGSYAPDALVERIRGYAAMVAPYAAKLMTPEEYDAAIQGLTDFVNMRAAEAKAFLAEQE